MKRLLTLLFCLLSAPLFADSATLRTYFEGQQDPEVKTFPLAAAEDGAQRLTIPVAELDPKAQYYEVQADFATAKTGDDGYWIQSRGVYGTFHEQDGGFTSNAMLPIFGMKTPERTFLAVTRGMKLEYTFVVLARGGVYSVFQRFDPAKRGYAPYEDVVVDFYTLTGDDTNYSGMGRFYRNLRLKNKEIRPLKERIASGENPWLAYLCDAMTVRITHASKPWLPKERVDYTPENEPEVRCILSFEDAKNVVLKLKEAGVEKAAICTAGWQSGGYDGRCPQVFPVEPAAGGEEALKDYIRYVKSLGFQIDGHSNYTDCYTCSKLWTPDIACQKPDGTLWFNGVWAGGNAYNLCPRNAWETFFCEDMDRIGTLGFDGAHYIDVFSAIPPYYCSNPKHPCNRKEAAFYQRKMLEKAREVNHGTGSECGEEHCLDLLDYINYVSRFMLVFYGPDRQPPKMVDGIVPLWEIVYHGTVLANTDKFLQNELDQKKWLKLVEFGGRPIFYSPNDTQAIADSYRAFKPLAYLQKEFMESHEYLKPGVARVVYSDGSEIIVNYTDAEFTWKDRPVKAMSYELYPGNPKVGEDF
ncbi:MAG: hypothetical protein IJQ31_13665 [Thermoguttaceae bacterium]|nr:hypothetical protein [Thermoguttaceae bacterium]